MNLLLYPEAAGVQATPSARTRSASSISRAACATKGSLPGAAAFKTNDDKPLIYVSFGSLGAADVELYRRMIALFAKLPYRFLMNVGDYKASTRTCRAT